MDPKAWAAAALAKAACAPIVLKADGQTENPGSCALVGWPVEGVHPVRVGKIMVFHGMLDGNGETDDTKDVPVNCAWADWNIAGETKVVAVGNWAHHGYDVPKLPGVVAHEIPAMELMVGTDEECFVDSLFDPRCLSCGSALFTSTYSGVNQVKAWKRKL